MARAGHRERRHTHAGRELGGDGYQLRLAPDLLEQSRDLARCVRLVERGTQFNRPLEVRQVLSELRAKLFVEHSGVLSYSGSGTKFDRPRRNAGEISRTNRVRRLR